MRGHRIPSRPHVQGSPAPLRVRHSAGDLLDGGGLVLLRRAWDQLGVGRWLDARTATLPGRYRPSLMVELWIALLLYGGGWMDDLALLGSRGIRRLFGWRAVPDPTTFGRWLRRCGKALVPLLDELVWRVVVLRWGRRGSRRGMSGSGRAAARSTVRACSASRSAPPSPTNSGSRAGRSPIVRMCSRTWTASLRSRPGGATTQARWYWRQLSPVRQPHVGTTPESPRSVTSR